MPTAPTLIAFAQAEAAVDTDVNVTTASISWQINDVVVAITACEGGTSGENLNTPTTAGSGITFGAAQQIHNSTGTDASAGVWAAVASANSSGTFSGSYTHVGGTGRNTAIGVYIFRGSAGIGNSAITATPSSTKTVSLTPTGADGSICWHVGDWNADTVQSFTPSTTTHGAGSPGPTASPYTQQVAGRITYYIGELDDQTSAGAVSYGIGGANAGPFTILAIEVKAGVSAAVGASIVQAAQPFPSFWTPFRDPTAIPFQLLGDASTQGPVAITLSDTGAATDAITVLVEADPNQAPEQVAWMFLEPSGASFQLQGDASTNAPTLITLLDAGTGSDALTVSAAVPLTDTGAGADSLTVSAAVPLTDVGAGSDGITVAADVPLADVGTGTDSISVNTGTDSYQAWPQNFPAFTAPFIEPTAIPFQLLGDRSTGIVLVSLSDTGAGDDQLSITVAVPLTDTAVGADSLTLTAAVPLNDTGAGVDALAATAAVPLGDVGTGDDQISILTLTVTDPNQAPLQRFGWGLLRPDGHIPFQMLGDANARQPETGGGSLTVTDRALVTFGAGDRGIADLRAAVRQVPTLGGGE